MKAPLSQTLFLTEDGSLYTSNAVTIPPIVIGIPPTFDGNPSFQSDGTPQVGEQLVGVDAAVLNLGSAILRRAWLLGSTVLVEDASFTPDDDLTYTFRNQLVVASVVVAEVSVEVQVAAATVTPTPTPSPGIPAPSISITGTPRVNDINFTGSGTGLNPDDGLQLDYGAGFKTLNGSFQFENDNDFLLDENMPAAGAYDFVFRVIRRYENEALLSQPIYGTATVPVAVAVQAALPPPEPVYNNNTAYRFYRYRATEIKNSTGANGFTSLAEMDVRVAPNLPNRISDAALTASSTLGGYPVDNIKDGKLQTFWHSGSNTLPEGIVLDFGPDPANWPKLNYIALTSRPDDNSGQMPISGDFQGSTDGTNWTAVIAWTGQTWVGSSETKIFTS